VEDRMQAKDLQKKYTPKRRRTNFVPRRKILINPFKVKPRPPAGFEAKSLMTLQNAVAVILRKDEMSFSREELYRLVESLCIHKKSQELYQKLNYQCKTHIQNIIRILSDRKWGKAEVGSMPERKDDGKFLYNVQKVWQDHSKQFSTIRSIFLYLDRTYVLPHLRLTSIRGMGLSLLRDSLQNEASVLRHISDAILAVIRKDRLNAGSTDASLLRTVLGMLSELKIYSSSFEASFLAETIAFYKAEGERLVSSLKIPEYLIHAERRLGEERKRVQDYLVEATKRPLIEAVEQTLIATHVKHLSKPGVESLVAANRKEDLQRMYVLFQRVDGLVPLRRAFLEYIKHAGAKIVESKNASTEEKMIPNLLAFKGHLDKLVLESFASDDEFSYALKQGFEHFVGAADYHVAELLARYLDGLLCRHHLRSVSDQEAEALFSPAMAVFSYVQSKDIFRGHYQLDLGNRLLRNRSTSRKIESMMLGKLRSVCGAEFTKAMEAMFRDISNSEEESETFRKAIRDGKVGTPPVDLGIRILTDGSWPEAKYEGGCNLPKEITDSQLCFEKFYTKAHTNRKLVWQYERSSAIVLAQYATGRKEFEVSAFQASILLAFSGGNRLTAAEIAKASGIEAKQLERTMLSLLNARIVKKYGDKYGANDDYRSKFFRIKVARVIPKAKAKERQKIQKQAFADRSVVIDAMVVRIMKMRKSLSHSELIGEVVKSVKFACTAKDIQTRIKNLLNRDFIEVDGNNPQVYNYRA